MEVTTFLQCLFCTICMCYVFCSFLALSLTFCLSLSLCPYPVVSLRATSDQDEADEPQSQ